MSIKPATRLLLLVLSVGLAVNIFQVEGLIHTDLHQKWAIAFPTVSLIQDNNTIIVDYDMHPDLTAENVRTKLMTENCYGPEVTQGILQNYVDTDGEHVFQLDISQLVVNETISTISEDAQNATLKFCLMYSLWSGDEEDYAIEINYIYNILSVYLSLDGAITMTINVDEFTPSDDDDATDDKERKEKLEKEKHILKCYLCHPVTHVPQPPPFGGFGLGDVVSICSEASQSVIDDNMFLKGVDNFLWRRTVMRGGIPFVTEQWAVKDGVPDALSTYHCPHRALFCTFTTMLNAEFFTMPGFVEGIGSTALKFGADRKLEVQMLDYEQAMNLRGMAASLPSEEEERQRQLFDESTANMAMWLPIRGPSPRPRLAEPKVEIEETKTANYWYIWLLISATFAVLFGVSASLFWREWHREHTMVKSRGGILS